MALVLLDTPEGRETMAAASRKWFDAGCPMPRGFVELYLSKERWPHVVVYDGHGKMRYMPSDWIPGFTREHGITWCEWFVPGTL